MQTHIHITHMNDNSKRVRVKRCTENAILLYTVFSPLRLSIPFLFCLCQIPVEAGNEELRQEQEKTN